SGRLLPPLGRRNQLVDAVGAAAVENAADSVQSVSLPVQNRRDAADLAQSPALRRRRPPALRFHSEGGRIGVAGLGRERLEPLGESGSRRPLPPRLDEEPASVSLVEDAQHLVLTQPVALVAA